MYTVLTTYRYVGNADFQNHLSRVFTLSSSSNSMTFSFHDLFKVSMTLGLAVSLHIFKTCYVLGYFLTLATMLLSSTDKKSGVH